MWIEHPYRRRRWNPSPEGLIVFLLLTLGQASASLSSSQALRQGGPESISIDLHSYPTNPTGVLANPGLHGRSHPFVKLTKRAGENDNCAKDYTSCQSVGDERVCCPSGQICTRDRNGNVGCCPLGAVCTGTVGTTSGQSSSSISSSVTPSSSSSSQTSSQTPQPSAEPGNDFTSVNVLVPGMTITSTQPMVANTYFPFPFIPTTFPDQAQCSSAWSACQSNSDICFSHLTSNGAVKWATDNDRGGLTIQAPNGGITVGGGGTFTGAGLPSESAKSVCSSLSQEACRGLQPTACQNFAPGGSGFILGTGSAPSLARFSALTWGLPLGIAVALVGGGMLVFV